MALDEFLVKNDPCRGKNLFKHLIVHQIDKINESSFENSNILSGRDIFNEFLKIMKGSNLQDPACGIIP